MRADGFKHAVLGKSPSLGRRILSHDALRHNARGDHGSFTQTASTATYADNLVDIFLDNFSFNIAISNTDH